MPPQLATHYNSLQINSFFGKLQDWQQNEAPYPQKSCSQAQVLWGNYVSTPDLAEMGAQVQFISHVTLSLRLWTKQAKTACGNIQYCSTYHFFSHWNWKLPKTIL